MGVVLNVCSHCAPVTRCWTSTVYKYCWLIWFSRWWIYQCDTGIHFQCVPIKINYSCRNKFFFITSGFFQYGNDIQKERGMVECKVESTLIQKKVNLDVQQKCDLHYIYYVINFLSILKPTRL